MCQNSLTILSNKLPGEYQCRISRGQKPARNLLDKVLCIHINDSKNIRGSHKDRHENIGYGTIGFDNLINIIYNKRLEQIPKILETPYINDLPPYKEEIEMIKNKKFNPNLKKDE